MNNNPNGRIWMNRKKEMFLYGIFLSFTLVSRLWDLDVRAFHHDESLHALYSWYINHGLGYQHMPMMHGPFQFLANSLFFFLLGDSDFSARLMYVLFGTALVGMPWFLRRELGQIGAIVAVGILTFSPTMFYFSRFARNDILMAVWVFGIVVCIWRFIGDSRPRYLFFLSAFIALSFVTKETVYLSLIIFIAYFGGWVILRWLSRFHRVNPLVQFENVQFPSISLWDHTLNTLRSPQGAVILTLGCLTLSQSAALVGLFQEQLNLVLLNKNAALGPVGLPDGNGMVPAVGITLLFVSVGMGLGLILSLRRWLLCLIIFGGIWFFFFTSGFTNPNGVITGSWQSLGYWIVQQEVGRGGQPWYYYLVLGWTYEFLPIFFSLVGVIFFSKQGGPFGKFLVFWLITTFGLFSIASEKMPWLLVHISLPAILLASLTLGRMIESVSWASLERSKAWAGVLLLPILILLLYRVFSLSDSAGLFQKFPFVIVLLVPTVVCGLAVKKFLFRLDRISALNFLGLSFAILLLIFSIRAGFWVTFRNQGIGNELLVYTQTSPDIVKISNLIQEVSFATRKGKSLSIVVDSDEGFTWPWAWYLREFEHVTYLPFGLLNTQSISGADVLLVNAKNVSRIPSGSNFEFVEIQEYLHRQWFPEVYRKSSLEKLADLSNFHEMLKYWVSRDIKTPMGSQGAVLYYSVDVVRNVFIGGIQDLNQNP